ncbi:MAG: DUF465 domain-containing protein [Nitrospinota bacterium]|nr:DUF465 domain-containing protein [Nitrospinota bacterium]
MMTSIQQNPAFDTLYKENEDFRELYDEYLYLKKETEKLNKLKSMTEEDHNRVHEIKIRKLQIKDILEAMTNSQ